MPQTITCSRAIKLAGRHSAATQEKWLFSTTSAAGAAASSSARVWPRPLGYCSEITVGSSSSFVAASSHRARARVPSGSLMAPMSFFLDVDDQQRGLVGIDQHCLPLAWEKA
ncbi:hypothetical protein PPS11_39763 [Pseudomonas putida S11]|nr:hypothetical protein PPS11_39763 [Pseudomonas putida S11]